MPRRNYRMQQLIQKKGVNYFTSSIQQTAPTTLVAPATTMNNTYTLVTNDAYSPYEKNLLAIIQGIIDRVNFDTILLALEPLQIEITSRAQAEKVLYSIQEIILGTVQNITDRVRLDIAMERLQYINYIIKEATDLPAVYNNISELLEYIIDSITNRESLETVLANLITTQTAMAMEVKLAEDIFIIQEVLIGCIQNIIDGVNYNIVLNRLYYLGRRMQEALHIRAS